MDTDIETLQLRLQQEEEHLDWFTKSGQQMSATGADTTAQYVAGVHERIANLQKQIANHKARNAKGS